MGWRAKYSASGASISRISSAVSSFWLKASQSRSDQAAFARPSASRNFVIFL